jgi:hypothetical protein
MLLGHVNDRELEVIEQCVIVVNERKVHGAGVTDPGPVKARGHPLAVGFVGDLFPDFREVLLAVGVLDVRQEFCPLPDAVHPAA